MPRGVIMQIHFSSLNSGIPPQYRSFNVAVTLLVSFVLMVLRTNVKYFIEKFLPDEVKIVFDKVLFEDVSIINSNAKVQEIVDSIEWLHVLASAQTNLQGRTGLQGAYYNVVLKVCAQLNQYNMPHYHGLYL